MQEAFELGDSLHRVAIKTVDAKRIDSFMPGVAALVPDDARLLDWAELLPEVAQSIEIDDISAQMIYWLLMIVVAMSVANAFIMTIFERTREFGMLLAIGMRPNAIVGMLVIEAACVWALGALLGATASLAVVVPLGQVGIDVAAVAEGMEEMAANIMMPTHIYPALTVGSLFLAPLVMLLGTVIAALVPALRVLRMKPVEALREEE
jgi:ABC-type antimicrobial peptide transport system permease subunit